MVSEQKIQVKDKHFTLHKIMYGITNTITVNVKIHQPLKDNKIEKDCSNKDLRVTILINQNYNQHDFFKGEITGLKEYFRMILSTTGMLHLVQ